MRRGSRQVKSILNYIDGQFVRGKREFADVNPADGSIVAQVTEADEGLVDDAVQAARETLRGEWSRIGVRERAARLYRVADAIEARFDCFVAAEVADTGKPVTLASKLDVPRAAPTGAMVTIKCSPWHVEGRAFLLGDAAHAIVHFFGQGINCGFEDCTCLLELLDRHEADWERVFREFEEARKINADAIADLAVENFVEMRDRVADPRFLFGKKVELALEARFPRRFVPKYAMVTFHRVPYAIAMKRGQVQDRMLQELCDGIERVEDLDWSKADRLICGALTPLELVS